MGCWARYAEWRNQRLSTEGKRKAAWIGAGLALPIGLTGLLMAFALDWHPFFAGIAGFLIWTPVFVLATRWLLGNHPL